MSPVVAFTPDAPARSGVVGFTPDEPSNADSVAARAHQHLSGIATGADIPSGAMQPANANQQVENVIGEKFPQGGAEPTAGDRFKEVVGGALRSIPEMLSPDLDVQRQRVDAIVGQSLDEIARAQQAASRPGIGGKVEAVGHAAAAALPGIGPMAAKPAEDFASGNLGGGAGGLAGLATVVAAPRAIAAVAPAVAEGGAAVGRAAGDAIGGAGDAIANTGRWLAEKYSAAPSALINETVNAAKSLFKFGKNPGNAGVGIVFNNADSLIEKLQPKIDTYTTAADRVVASRIQQNPQLPRIDYKAQIEHAFDEPIQKARNDGREDFALDLEKYRDGRIATAEKMAGGAPSADAAQAQAIKRNLGDDTNWSKEMTEQIKTLNDAKQVAYVNMKNAVNRVVPELEPLNERIADALSLKKAAEAMRIEGLRHASLNPLTWFPSGIKSGAAALIDKTIPRPSLGEEMMNANTRSAVTNPMNQRLLPAPSMPATPRPMPSLSQDLGSQYGDVLQMLLDRPR